LIAKFKGMSIAGLMPSASSGTNSLTESQGFSATTLGGRTPSVLSTREILYRICEMTSNLQLNSEDTVKAYLSALDKITEIIKAQNAANNSVPTAHFNRFAASHRSTGLLILKRWSDTSA
jgi:hypothetical protein